MILASVVVFRMLLRAGAHALVRGDQPGKAGQHQAEQAHERDVNEAEDHGRHFVYTRLQPLATAPGLEQLMVRAGSGASSPQSGNIRELRSLRDCPRSPGESSLLRCTGTYEFKRMSSVRLMARMSSAMPEISSIARLASVSEPLALASAGVARSRSLRWAMNLRM